MDHFVFTEWSALRFGEMWRTFIIILNYEIGV